MSTKLINKAKIDGHLINTNKVAPVLEAPKLKWTLKALILL